MFRNILIPVDLEAEAPLERAITAVRGLADKSAIVRFQHVVYSTPALVSQFLPQDFEQKATVECLNRLKEAVRAEDLGDLTTDFIITHGVVYDEILQLAEDEGTDLIVLSSHQPGVKDYLLGSNAARVVRHAKCTVMILR